MKWIFRRHTRRVATCTAVKLMDEYICMYIYECIYVCMYEIDMNSFHGNASR